MIRFTDVHFGYKTRKPVLERFNLDLQPGSVYGVLGANGVGKTTLLHLISGLLFPQSGQIHFGNFIPGERKADFLEQIFYVPVEFEIPALNSNQYKERFAPFYPHFDHSIWDKALKTFSLNAQESMKSLSFGQKKKVMLAFALSSGCPVLLFDEPTDGLDIPSKDAFRRLLSTTISEERIALITTHHVQDIAMLLDHLIVLQDTSILLQASMSDLSTQVRSLVTTQQPTNDVLLYAERAPGGYHCIVRNTENETGTLDLELLFKGLQSTPELLTSIQHKK